MPSLDFLARLFRGRPRPGSAELNDYGRLLAPIVARLRELYASWSLTLEHVSREDELANAASIRRWETTGLLDELRRIQPPPPLAEAQLELESIINDTARASQLLSNGYRFTSSRARCDGQALMLDCQERLEALCQALSADGVTIPDQRPTDQQASLVASGIPPATSQANAVRGPTTDSAKRNAGGGARRSE